MVKKSDWDDESTSEIRVSLLPVSMEAKPFVLQMVQGPGAPKDFDLFADELVLGRASDADIPINSTDLSRRHVRFKKSGGQFTVEDLGSCNGVYLNGLKVHAAVLHEGDNVQLGTVVFIYREGRE